LIVLVLVALGLWIDLPPHPSIKLGAWQRDLNIKLGLDLQGGVHLVYRANLEGISDNDILFFDSGSENLTFTLKTPDCVLTSPHSPREIMYLAALSA